MARPTELSTWQAPAATRPLAARVKAWAQRSRAELEQRLLGADFEERLAQLRQRYSEQRPDVFGLEVDALESAARFWSFFHRAYFRTEIHDIDRLPATGRVMVVANHSGQLPLDAVILGCSLFFDAERPRVARAMVDRWAATLPFVSSFFSRLGSVVGSQANARTLLEHDEALLVFPEGVRGIAKPFNQRYQLQDFGLGFMRIALATGTPILPVAVIGAEEQYINLGNSAMLARLFKMPVYPLIPQMYVPGGQLPLPTKYRLYFGEPLHFTGSPDESDEQLTERVFLVRQSIQQLLTTGLQRRRSAFF